ncbi:NAD(P)H-dependent oxidoreductase [Propionimicrobium sp. PCR01-08-3]|uniref:NADPH-dependent FMN reductase n=1 Tax=Propionimicrobium sp. PCR01-08-3 TaxID=3052086 RepID=UPI00255C3DDC|nr:NAD(P)H-dependent oxidoreductase [Propionimicrobium sp. PCR01-08-3]WIY82878.1 NAD(P)H-dependent oxidoreductase [Propionimicrobium sp. PCR01-08-3]
MKVGIIVGSIREGRRGLGVGKWVLERASERREAEFELIDLKEFDVPLLTSRTLPSVANKQYGSENVRRWSAAIDACDAYIFVTPEYNHGLPGAFKNAVDTLGPEWTGKPVGFVSYGSVEGIRAAEQWRQVVVNFSMVDVRAQVSLSNFTEFADDGTPTPRPQREIDLKALLDQLLDAARRAAR